MMTPAALLAAVALITGAAALVPSPTHPLTRLVVARPAPRVARLARVASCDASPQPARQRLTAAYAELPRSKQTAILGGGGGAAYVVLRRLGVASLALQLVCLVWPLVSAWRLLRTGKRREAATIVLMAAYRRFCNNWLGYLTIPLFAGGVGWLTNKVAVDMIFYPVEFGGLRLKTWPSQPLGWIGWQGIVPCKAGVMAGRLTDIVTGKLVSVPEVFGRLEPSKVAELMAPGVDRIAEQIVGEMLPAGGAGGAMMGAGRARLRGLSPEAAQELLALRHRFVAGLTRDMQQHIESIVDLREVVVGGMVREKRLLIDLFQRCGAKELAFLVNSGFGFGCVLGVFQMLLWLFFELPWTLAAGGAVVGYLTNWIALKLIFEPVEPRRIGPFVLQGLFLKRQHEVSAEFADCMTEQLLTSESLWNNVLTGSKSDAFAALLRKRTDELMGGAAAVLYGGAQPTEYAGAWWADLQARVSGRILKLLPQELPLMHSYVDETLALKGTLKTNLRRLTPQEFERVLHPVFEEDELTLVFVGAVLGGAVGWAQAWWDARSKRLAAESDAAPDAAA